ncbi:MAG: NAD(P)/FAD-dependent oxidoreductase [Caulobacteraceae bacterium]|nr:NAD(P)/FAD-dependent oxidoreductase [Caulobacteraceae bacterium]
MSIVEADIHPDFLALLGEIDFDPEALHARYLVERDKRLRSDGTGQYLKTRGAFSHFDSDPFSPEPAPRAPVGDAVEAAVIGAGFGGLMAAAHLRRVGVGRIRLIDIAADVGGTWYWNRYPGAMCDIESYCYLPLLEELGYMPKHKYSFAPEIFEHSRRIARAYGLYEDALFQTAVTELAWSEEKGRWRVSTDRGDAFEAEYVVMANGPLGRPKLPGIAGIESFRGHMFHTSRWDYGYTGGGPEGGLAGLADKKVGVVGTGATAIQCVPHLGASAQRLYVFQRTPSSVDVRGNRETDPVWWASLEPGWQDRRSENFDILVSGGHQDEDLVADGWTDIFRRLTGRAAAEAARRLGRRLSTDERARLLELADYKKMNEVRARAAAIVEDPAVAETLKPWYRQFCKRPCFHDEYLDTFNRPSVSLVDTEGKGLERLTPAGAVANGREYELDCLIFATGFEVGNAFTERVGYEVIGRDGRTLSAHWAEGPRTFHGLTIHGFPNAFLVSRTQVATTSNLTFGMHRQIDHLAYMISRAHGLGHRVLEAEAEAEAAWVEEIRRGGLARINERFYQECTPGYYNSEGSAGNKTGFFSHTYGGGSIQFNALLRAWREDGRMTGIALR